MWQDRSTPLLLAARDGFVVGLKALISAKASVDAINQVSNMR